LLLKAAVEHAADSQVVVNTGGDVSLREVLY
jgi:hypothetical protein